MAIRAGELWRALEQLTGNSLLTLTGRLDHGNQRRVKQLHVTLGEAGVAHEILSAETAAICWPHMHFETDVLYVPESGVIDPDCDHRDAAPGE